MVKRTVAMVALLVLSGFVVYEVTARSLDEEPQPSAAATQPPVASAAIASVHHTSLDQREETDFLLAAPLMIQEQLKGNDLVSYPAARP